jgi:HD-GYP domain-containing protein (c-di-GMP phosphodiesterase class II)
MRPGSIILGVAAVVDAMSTHHPCEPSLVVELALDEISQHRGILFDPRVVAALARFISGNMFSNCFRDHAC